MCYNNYVMYNVQDYIALFIIMSLAWLYMKIDNLLLTCGKYTYWHDRVISLRGQACAYSTTLSLPFLLKWIYHASSDIELEKCDELSRGEFIYSFAVDILCIRPFKSIIYIDSSLSLSPNMTPTLIHGQTDLFVDHQHHIERSRRPI